MAARADCADASSPASKATASKNPQCRAWRRLGSGPRKQDIFHAADVIEWLLLRVGELGHLAVDIISQTQQTHAVTAGVGCATQAFQHRIGEDAVAEFR